MQISASLFLLTQLQAYAATTVLGAQGLSVTVDDSGSYTVLAGNLPWRFTGYIGHSVSNLESADGIDAIGGYSEVSFDFQAGAPRHAGIRAYRDDMIVLFTLGTPSGGPNNFSFPEFVQTPALGLNHLAFSDDFGAPLFTSLPGQSPWLFFDTAGNGFVFSAASHFMVAESYWGPTSGRINSHIPGQIQTLPAGFSQSSILVIDSGINATLEKWGRALTTLQGKRLPSNDAGPILNKIGYWTDNGATYYYGMEANLSYPDTLAAVKAGFDALGIKLGYLQLDSWFYPKGPAADWTDSRDGIFQYDAAPSLFGANLSNFAQRIGVPLVTHARWIDPSSPYRQQYAMSGNVVVDPQYWAMVAGYLKSSGVATYEQDWLNAQAQTALNLSDAEAFLGNMAQAMSQQGIDMQYCMPAPRHYLQSTRYSNLTNMRVSQDRFNRAKWTNFLYGSRLASALGVWPFSDVFMSGETENLLLATLSAGPVGIGDRVGKLSAANLFRAVRPDGVIVKPDAPIVPIDASVHNSAQALDAPMIASTYTDLGGRRSWYIFAYPQGQNTNVAFRLADLGAAGSLYLYDYFAGSGSVVKAGDLLNLPILNSSLYLIAVPVGESGMAMLGDIGQFVTLGKKRITNLTDDGAIHATVSFAAGEMARTVQFWSPGAPRIRMHGGSVIATEFDNATGRFLVTLTPGADGNARIQVLPSAVGAPGHRSGSGGAPPPNGW